MREDKVVGVPPDELRCERNDGKAWRCTGWKLQNSCYCNHHDLKHRLPGSNSSGRRVKTETKENVQVQENSGVGKRRKRKSVEMQKKTRQIKKEHEGVSDIKISEGCNIPELIELLQTVYQDKEFQLVEDVFKLREEKMKVEKEDAKKLLVYLEKELGVYETKCAELSHELEKRKEETTALEEKVKELECEKIDFEVKRQDYDKMCNKLQEDLEIARQGERISNERIQHLKRTKIVAENEVEVWKKRCEELEIMVLFKPQLLLSGVSDTWGGKKSRSRQTKLQVQVKEETMDHIARPAVEGKPYASSETTIQNKTECVVNGARFSPMKIKEESLESGLAHLADSSCDKYHHVPLVSARRKNVKQSPPGFERNLLKPTAKNDDEAKEFEPAIDSITAYLSELQKLTAKNSKGKGILVG